MEIYYFIDIGYVILMIILLLVMLGGGASAIAGFIADHIPLLIIIGIVLLIIQIVAMWFFTKRVWAVVLSALYPTQLYFYIIRGIYGLSLIVFTDHPIKFIITAFFYFLYGLLNFCGLMLSMSATLEYASTEEEYVSFGGGALVVLANLGLGLLGWFLNIIIFQIGA